MDITSDVEVLENMLRQDGLSDSTAFRTVQDTPKHTPSSSVESDSAQQVCQEMENIITDLDDDQNQGITLQI